MIFITGGVRSGKSSYAEKRAVALWRKQLGTLHYIATGRVYDEEMATRVAHHERNRKQSGIKWNVHEKTNDIDDLFPHFHRDDVVLLDCVTTLVSNELFVFSKKREEKWKDEQFVFYVKTKLETLFSMIAKAPWKTIVVSNELFFDVHTNDRDTELYKWLLGNVHSYIVQLAEEAIVVECGIPCWKKGEVR